MYIHVYYINEMELKEKKFFTTFKILLTEKQSERTNCQ